MPSAVQGASADAHQAGRSKAADMPFGEYKRQQASISRRRMYPMTVFYTSYTAIVAAFVLRSEHPLVGVLFAALGLGCWTLLEYLSHRYVLHGRFPDGEGFIRKFMHRRLDPLHFEHHAHPWDGHHINGVLKDTLPLFVVFAPLSFLFPVYTLPICYAAFVQGYVMEEWIHHSVHFYPVRTPYLRYVRRHHLYHHSPKGERRGYGITSAMWDAAFNTRYPEKLRRTLHGGGAKNEARSA